MMKNFLYLIFIGSVVGLLIKLFVFEIFTVPTASMEPTILRGSKVWLQKMFFNLQKGDVVGFERNNEYFVKRIVGIPSDSVYTEFAVKGSLFELLKPKSILFLTKKYVFYKIPKKGATVVLDDTNFAFYQPLIERNEGVAVNKIINKIFVNNLESNTYTFKHNYYFLQGDNTEGSEDSRHFGLVGENQIKGAIHF